MKDRIFTGADVADARAAAAASLGLPVAGLRYVVLDEGSAGGRGLKPNPARIAVVLEGRAVGGGPREASSTPEAPKDARAGIREVVRALAAAAHLDLEAEIEEGEETLLVRLSGGDREFLLGRDGKGEVLRSLEHLLQRMYGAEVHPRALRLDCEGYRDRREHALAEEAHRLAAAVRADGQARTMEPLNAYERRLVHVALQGEPGVTTYSVGEGASRRVTVAPAAGDAAPPEDGHAPD